MDSGATPAPKLLEHGQQRHAADRIHVQSERFTFDDRHALPLLRKVQCNVAARLLPSDDDDCLSRELSAVREVHGQDDVLSAHAGDRRDHRSATNRDDHRVCAASGDRLRRDLYSEMALDFEVAKLTR